MNHTLTLRLASMDRARSDALSRIFLERLSEYGATLNYVFDAQTQEHVVTVTSQDPNGLLVMFEEFLLAGVRTVAEMSYTPDYGPDETEQA